MRSDTEDPINNDPSDTVKFINGSLVFARFAQPPPSSRLVQFPSDLSVHPGALMPELPEVETVVRDLRPLIVGRTIEGVRIGRQKLRTPWKPQWKASVTGCRIEAIRRRGKWIAIAL